MSTALDEKIYEELRSEFISETRDNLEDMEGSLNDFFSNNIIAADTLQILRQNTHTIKGLARPFGFSLLEDVAHQFEDFMLVLSKMSQADVGAVQKFIDTMKECLFQVEEPDRKLKTAILENLPKVKFSIPIALADEKAMNIVIITSSRTVYKKIASELDTIGFDIHHAANSYIGIELTAKSQPDVVIVSDILDSMSGVDLVCAFVAMPVTADIPVIYMTSFDQENAEIKKLPPFVPIISLGSNIEDEILSALTAIERRFIPDAKTII